MKSSKKPFWQRVIDPQAISIVKFIHSLDHGLIPCVPFPLSDGPIRMWRCWRRCVPLSISSALR